MRRRIPIIISVAFSVLLLGGIAYAVLSVGSAEIEADVTMADPALDFLYADLSGSSDNAEDLYTTVDGAGTAYVELVDGKLEITITDAWVGTSVKVGDIDFANGVVYLRSSAPAGASIDVTGIDFTGAAGFGAPGSGEPIIVELVDPATSNPWILPRSMIGPSGDGVSVLLTVDGAVAESGATYGPATLSVLGTPTP